MIKVDVYGVTLLYPEVGRGGGGEVEGGVGFGPGTTWWTCILSQPATEPLPSVALDQGLEGEAQLVGIEDVIEDEGDGHVVALDQQAVFKKMQRQDPVGGHQLNLLSPSKQVSQHFYVVLPRCSVVLSDVAVA